MGPIEVELAIGGKPSIEKTSLVCSLGRLFKGMTKGKVFQKKNRKARGRGICVETNAIFSRGFRSPSGKKTTKIKATVDVGRPEQLNGGEKGGGKPREVDEEQENRQSWKNRNTNRKQGRESQLSTFRE